MVGNGVEGQVPSSECGTVTDDLCTHTQPSYRPPMVDEGGKVTGKVMHVKTFTDTGRTETRKVVFRTESDSVGTRPCREVKVILYSNSTRLYPNVSTRGLVSCSLRVHPHTTPPTTRVRTPYVCTHTTPRPHTRVHM